MSERTDRSADGRNNSDPSDDDLVSYFEGGRPFRTAEEVADRFGVDQSTARRRLSRLTDDSQLRRVTLNEQTVVWWRGGEPVDEEQTESGDPLFDAPTFTADEPVDESSIDDILYGNTEP